MVRLVKSFLKSSITISMALYAGLLVLSSFEYFLSMFVNLVGFSFAISQLNKNKTTNNIIHYLIRFSIGNLLVMHVMVQSYAELLPYEIVIHVVLYAIVYYFYYCYKKAAANGSNSSVYDFKKTVYLEKKS
jgi:hypothetical protein